MKLALPVLSCLLFADYVSAQAPAGRGPIDPATKVARARRVSGVPPRVDAVLDDEAWRGAAWFSDFVMKEPVEGGEPTERTEVAFLYDDRNLYVALRAYSNDPSAIQSSVTRRDGSGLAQSEHIWISLDTYLDRRTAYSFGISASGTRTDFYHPEDHEYRIDMSYDPVWEGRARVDSLGWTAELRIPFSQLRFRNGAVQVWGLNVDRWIPSRNEDLFWVPVPRNVTAWSSRMGTLVGIEGIRPPRRLELLPYMATNGTVLSDPDPSNPFDPDGRQARVRAGADFKLGLGPNLTLEATVNPDFGQVEADPAVVNLSAFEVFFDERRPFFTEGSRLLSGNGPNYFYSRRLGAPPPGSAGGDYQDRPSTSTILGAAKLTGRLHGGLSIGALAAVTSREWARTYTAARDSLGRTEVAPPTVYGVARLQQEFGASGSTVGGMLTFVERDLTPGSGLEQILTRRAVSGGLDWRLRLGGRYYELSGGVGFSHVLGDSMAILRQQLSSRRYYQRPDQDYVRLDSSRTALSGWTGGLALAKVSGRHWLWFVETGIESPGLELNDAGRISTADGRFHSVGLTYRETEPGRLFRSYAAVLSSSGEWNFGGDRQVANTTLDVQATWRNQWQTFVTLRANWRAQDERLTRGGPSMGTPLGWTSILQLRSNFAASQQWSARVFYQRTELDGLTYRLSGGLTVRPGTRWLLSVSPNYLRSVNPQQYIATIPDPSAAATYGARYVFGRVEQSEWSMPVRFSYAFTPDLTLEVFVQPFIASGRFDRFGELPAPRARDLRVYGRARGTSADSVDASGTSWFTADGTSIAVARRDFNRTSFNSNVVLRWEWRPGSTVFVVWQQNRDGTAPSGDLVRIPHLFRGLSASGNQFLAVKISYWLAG